jgi:hypothetical protein
VLVMDENVDETLVAPGDEVQRFFAAASVIWCTPQARVDTDSEVIGAVMRPAKLRRTRPGRRIRDRRHLADRAPVPEVLPPAVLR